MLKYLLITLGTVSLGIGITGIFIPGLPTTPFVLLTASLYLRSSDRLYQWLLGNRYLSAYITEFRIDRGLSLAVKIYSLTIMWSMILMSAFLFIESTLLRVVLLVVGAIGSWVMGKVIHTRNPTTRE